MRVPRTSLHGYHRGTLVHNVKLYTKKTHLTTVLRNDRLRSFSFQKTKDTVFEIIQPRTIYLAKFYNNFSISGRIYNVV
jgi:hypothetical protein